jgi:hypothetical protein
LQAALSIIAVLIPFVIAVLSAAPKNAMTNALKEFLQIGSESSSGIY